MNRIQTFATVFGCLMLAVVSFLLGSATQLSHDNENMIQLRQQIQEKDSLIDVQHLTIIQLVYQHEDDDALAEEEQP